MNKKILTVAETVSNEKSLPKEKIFEALESALETATKKKHEQEIDVRVSINRNNGSFYTYRRWMVVKKVKKPTKEITLDAASYKHKNIKIGDFIEYKIKSIIFDRITTQTAKQVIVQKIKEAKKLIILEKLKKKIGNIIKGTIKKINKENLIIDIGYNTEALITKNNITSKDKDKFKLGDKIKSILYKIKKKKNGYQIFLSRSKNEMIIELLKIEIPEIKEKTIQIMSIAREPGLRSKIAVKTKDKRIDPIGACIGIRGSRIQAVSNELSGEKIDIILWDKKPKNFIINAMAPAKILSIKSIKNKNIINLSVKENNLAKAIGKNGQNVKLASLLTGWEINIISKNKNLKTK